MSRAPRKPSRKSKKHRLTAPDTLTADEIKYFHVIATRLAEDGGRDLDSYTELVQLAAQRLVEIKELDEVIRKHGRIHETQKDRSKSTYLRMNPAVDARDKAAKHLHRLLTSLRLTPDSTKLGSTGATESEWDEFGIE